MSEQDIKNLTDLAKEELEKGVTREEALSTFMEAGILDKEGNFTEPYQILASVITPIQK
jgi:hypothetical protein